MSSPLKVGIIGANAQASWAKDSHVPALQNLPDLELSAVATSNIDTARAAAQAFGARDAFASGLDLIHQSDVDIVSVCVKVPHHRELVLAALSAGKHVYCEWPLGANLAEAQEMHDAAERAGVHVAIGLQARWSPATRQAKTLLESGALGRLLAARVYSSTSGWGAQTLSSYAYLDQTQNGASLVTILGGHTLDLAQLLLGDIASLSAQATTRFPEIALLDTGKTLHREVADNFAVLARHESGCALVLEGDGGQMPESPFRFEIVGTNGKLALVGGDLHGFQGGPLQLHTSIPVPPVTPAVAGELPPSAVNVSEIYAQLAPDIREGTRLVPDFAHAVRLTRLVGHVLQAAETGQTHRAAPLETDCVAL